MGTVGAGEGGREGGVSSQGCSYRNVFEESLSRSCVLRLDVKSLVFCTRDILDVFKCRRLYGGVCTCLLACLVHAAVPQFVVGCIPEV